MREKPNKIADIGIIVVIVGLFAALGLAPPDTSLSELRKGGLLRACVPDSYGPLVTGSPGKPGFEIELLEKIAQEIDVRLSLNINNAIGKDFNPRSWRVNRAQCQIIAGGVVATTTTRNYLDTTPAYLETGWVVLSRGDMPDTLDGLTVGVHAGVSGRDRLALSQMLRASNAKISLVNDAEDLSRGLAQGRFDVGVTDSLIGRGLAGSANLQIEWLMGAEHREQIVLGLWKGDLTLKRKVVAIMDGFERDGTLDALRQAYGIGPIDRRFGVNSAETEDS